MLASLSRESKEGREREREREREKRGRKRWGHRLVFYDNYECKNKEVFVSFLVIKLDWWHPQRRGWN